MPLRSSNEPGRYEFNAERVRFEMIADNEERVRCAITSYALRYFDRRMKDSAKAQLHVFSTYRQAIETPAVKKYDRGRLDTDGGVLILQGDVPSSANILTRSARTAAASIFPPVYRGRI